MRARSFLQSQPPPVFAPPLITEILMTLSQKSRKNEDELSSSTYPRSCPRYEHFSEHPTPKSPSHSNISIARPQFTNFSCTYGTKDTPMFTKPLIKHGAVAYEEGSGNVDRIMQGYASLGKPNYQGNGLV